MAFLLSILLGEPDERWLVVRHISPNKNGWNTARNGRGHIHRSAAEAPAVMSCCNAAYRRISCPLISFLLMNYAQTVMSQRIDYMPALKRRNWITWLWAGAGALVMNAALFVLLPHLLQPAAKPAFEQEIPQVTMIRLKRPEPPREQKQVDPPKQHKPRRHPRPSDKPEVREFSIPFECAPGLSGPGTLEIPVIPPSFNKEGPSLFDSSDLDRPLIVLSRMPPAYPPSALHRGIEGWVKVRFVGER